MATKTSFKRFAESVTDWLNKYRFDPLFRTEVSVIALQGIFALLILWITRISFESMYGSVIGAISKAIETGAFSNVLIQQQIEHLGDINLSIVAGIIILTTVIFGYIIARVALAPVRNSLSSQKRFIGNIAHELRNPLSIMKMNTELALLNPTIGRELKATLESNAEEMTRISEIINNLLSLSVLVRPERMRFSAVNLSEVVSRIVRQYTATTERNRLYVNLHESHDILVWGNVTALEQIVRNILKNAIHYTPPSGTIDIKIARSSDRYAELVIQDSGIGIPRKDIFHIFEPFYRTEQSRAYAHEGSGLGLTIVSELVKMHSGKITVRSAPGHGTTAIVLLPMPPAGNSKKSEPENSQSISEVSVNFLSKNHQ